MCDDCFQSVRDTFPEIPEDEIGGLLMNCTAYPMASTETIAEQLRDYRRRTDNWRECYRLVEEDMTPANPRTPHSPACAPLQDSTRHTR